MVVISSSYGVSTLLGKLPFFRVENKTDFDALRIAAAFPNIVALPILIFPTLCEYAVVHDAFYKGDNSIDADEPPTEADKYKSCVDQSNAMIFVYFFGWNFLFWIIGYPTLMKAGSKRQISRVKSHATIPDVHLDDSDDAEQQQNISPGLSIIEDPGSDSTNAQALCNEEELPITEDSQETNAIIRLVANAFLKTVSSPGFIAMILGFITACIPPLRDAMFQPGGALRFFGSAMESLGMASSSVGTIVVAASLMQEASDDDVADEHNNHAQSNLTATLCMDVNCGNEIAESTTRKRPSNLECSMANENQPPANDRRDSLHRRSSLSEIESMVRRRSSLALAAIRRRNPTIRMHAWFIASRLIFAPALICAVVVAMDCGGSLSGIPDLAKMVVIVNSGLPGAQLIVITLKSRGLTDSASIVAKVYLPSYLLSAVTIAAWTSIGLLVSIRKDDGTSFCSR